MNKVRVTAQFFLLSALLISDITVRAQSLHDFGYANTNLTGVPISNRRLLIVRVNYADGRTWVHDNAYYDKLLFNFLQRPSINGFFLENSKGRFLWTRAGTGLIEINLTADDNKETNDNKRTAAALLAAMRTSFDFAQFDENSDKIVDSTELAILFITNSGDLGGMSRVANTGGKNQYENLKPTNQYPVSLRQFCAWADHRASFTTIAHELTHLLGAVDLYGSYTSNQNCTLMGATIFSGFDDDQQFHLDPWHKMQLGWAEPRLVSLRSSGTASLPKAAKIDKDTPILFHDPQRPDEFFMLEYRTPHPASPDYDTDVCDEGLLIWHIQQDTAKKQVTIDNKKQNAVVVDNTPTSRVAWRSGEITPFLRWFDGSEERTRVKVNPFRQGDDAITIDWLDRNSPRPAFASGRYSGSLIQSGFGIWGNYELLTARGAKLTHYWRDNDTPGFPWNQGSDLTLPANETPSVPAFFQGSFRSGNGPGNFEAITRSTKQDGSSRLIFHWYDAVARIWNGPYDLVADNEPITEVNGASAFFPSTYGVVGNFELIVPRGNRLAQYYRDNDAGGLPWRYARDLPVPAATSEEVIRSYPVDAVGLQGNFNSSDGPGNFELIVRMDRILGRDGGYLTGYWFDRSTFQWNGAYPIIADGRLIEGVTGTPAFLQSTYGGQGNFELIVPQGNRLAHYWRDNDAEGFPWHFAGDLPIQTSRGGKSYRPLRASMVQGNFGDPYNLDLIAQMTPTSGGGSDLLDFFWFGSDSDGSRRWHGPYPLDPAPTVTDDIPWKAPLGGFIPRLNNLPLSDSLPLEILNMPSDVPEDPTRLPITVSLSEIYRDMLETPSVPVIPGDVDGSGVVNIRDATQALRITVGLVTPDREAITRADMNGDGKISLQDVLLILRKAVGL